MDSSPSSVGEISRYILQYKLPLLLGIISIGCIGVAALFLVQSTQTHKPIEFVMGEATGSAQVDVQQQITVDVAGGVVKAGVYKLPVGSRMADAIEKAGGLSKEASTELLEKAINQAQKVQDGAKIYIPKKSDEGSKGETTSHNQIVRRENEGDDTSYNLGIDSNSRGLISINSASQSELETLSGVGPATATKIIDGRPYVNIEELVVKKAVGQKLFDKIKSQLSL